MGVLGDLRFLQSCVGPEPGDCLSLVCLAVSMALLLIVDKSTESPRVWGGGVRVCRSDGDRDWTQEPCSSVVCGQVCLKEGCVIVQSLVCVLLIMCTHVCDLRPLWGSCGREGFLGKEAFRKGPWSGGGPGVASLPVTSARLFGSSEPQFPCLPGGDIIIICPGVGYVGSWRPSLVSVQHLWVLDQSWASGPAAVLSSCDREL